MGSSSGSTQVQNSSGSEQTTTDIRKRKRMLSNRESARRSRQRKQKHLDDLTAQINQLKSQNGQILSTMNVTTQLYMNFEAENSILRAQLNELTNRLNSLNEIIHFLNPPPQPLVAAATATTTTTVTTSDSDDQESCFGGGRWFDDLDFDDGFSVVNPWGVDTFANHPFMPASDAFIC